LFHYYEDTAWIYQSFGSDGEDNTTNEELVGKAMKKYGREKFVLATKCGITFGPNGPIRLANEDLIRSQLADSLQRLDTDYIDLYYVHRMPTDVSIEEMMETMKKLVAEGKIKYVGLSECTPDELRRAHKIFPVTAIQMEWSLQSRDIEESVVPTARELGIGIVAYSPLGRGLLSHTFTKREDLDEKDWRLSNPRFSAENFDENARSIEKFNGIAERLGVSYAQLALAWVHAQGDDVFPIPGTKTPSRAVENSKAYDISKTLTPDVVAEIADSVGEFKGDRYPNQDGQWNTRV
jgi:aryl-alcohol dehydrogenase-like predicted oxidoreductase